MGDENAGNTNIAYNPAARFYVVGKSDFFPSPHSRFVNMKPSFVGPTGVFIPVG